LVLSARIAKGRLPTTITSIMCLPKIDLFPNEPMSLGTEGACAKAEGSNHPCCLQNETRGQSLKNQENDDNKPDKQTISFHIPFCFCAVGSAEKSGDSRIPRIQWSTFEEPMLEQPALKNVARFDLVRKRLMMITLVYTPGTRWSGRSLQGVLSRAPDLQVPRGCLR
jgi:hypothetical protein